MKEGSFEGLMSGLDFNNDRDRQIQNIKTPDQLPDPVNLAHLPENVSRSAVIESLINQNDDLMARLNVALRRVDALEEKVSDARNESAQYKAKYENVKDQILVLREQARLLNERSRQAEERAQKEDRDIQALKEQIQVLEIRYAELYTTTQERRERLENDLSLQQRALRRFHKYRLNMKRALATSKTELQQLREKKLNFEAVVQDLRHNLAETTQYITTQAKDHKLQLQNLTEAYETEVRNLKNEITQFTEKNRVLGERASEVDRLFTEKVRLENELIIAERREQDIRLQAATEASDLQKALARYRNEAKDLALQLEGQTQANQALTDSNAQLTSERAAMNEQVETLQLLWREQQAQIEKLTTQKNSLQKLNQELSISINDYRREVRELKEKLDAETMKLLAADRTSQYQEHLKKVLAATPVTNEAPAPSATPDLLAKIDQVITRL